jgi:hypothetical protein
VARLAVAAALFFGIVLTCTGVAGAATGGEARILGQDQSTPLNAGGSQTHFAIGVPSGARCSGDSAHDGYRVDSYVLPRGVDPASIAYRGIVPTRGLVLSATGNEPFYATNTAPVTGQIVFLPNNVNWSAVAASDVLPGGTASATWDVGLACAAPTGKATQYWNVEVIFRASRTDPGGFTWTVATPLRTPSQTPWGVISICAILAVTGGSGVLLLRRDARRSAAA